MIRSALARDRTAAHLAALLHDATVPLGGLDHHRAFVEDVRERFLDVDVLALGQGRQCDRSVPVVGRGDDDCIDAGIAEHVFELLRLACRSGLEVADDRLLGADLGRVNVAEPREVDVFASLHQAADVMSHDAAAADDAQPDGLGCRLGCRMGSDDAGRGHRGRGRRCLLQEGSAIGRVGHVRFLVRGLAVETGRRAGAGHRG